MRTFARAVCVLIVTLVLTTFAPAQSGRSRTSSGGTENKKTSEQRSEPSRPGTDAAPASDDDEREAIGADVVRVDTNLVTVPVIVATRNGTYIPDMQREEFSIFEDGVEQELVFFATVTEPFHVVLMIDTSASTEEKLSQIARAATAFVAELQPADRVKLISFDDRVRDFGDFTNDRAEMSSLINGLRPGSGTKLYDAMDAGLAALKNIKGRKAIVIFTDGVDWHSDRKDAADNFRLIEESGIIIYPIRYDTRADVERLARAQARAGRTVDLGTIFGGGLPSGTPPTFPGGVPQPTGRRTPGTLPGPIVISRDPNDDRTTGGRTSDPDARSRNPDPRNDPTAPPTTPGARTEEQIRIMLDDAYRWADSYLNDLSIKSGGRLLRADTLGNLPTAFAQIAAELRTQYSLGYYPPKETARDGKFHKIQIRSARKGTSVRARPGYRAPKSSDK